MLLHFLPFFFLKKKADSVHFFFISFTISPRSMLILRKLHYVPSNFSELKVWIPVITEVLKQPAATRGHNVRHPIAQAWGREECTAGAEEAGGTACTTVLCFRSRGSRDITTTSVCKPSCNNFRRNTSQILEYLS